MIAGKLERALAGEADPEADDLDAMEAFKSQYLNMWQLTAPRVAPGAPIITEPEWVSLLTAQPEGTPTAVAVEAWFAEGVCVAYDYSQPDGSLVTSVVAFPDAASAATDITKRGASAVTVGKSIATDPAFATLAVTPRGGTSKAALQEFKRLLDEGLVNHDGSTVLTNQVLGVRTVPSSDGMRVRSTGRLDGIKAVVWASVSARALQESPTIF